MNRHLAHVSPAFRLSTLLGLLALSTAAIAAPPQISYLEKAQTQASGNQIRSFAVPTTTSAGKLTYWDVTVDVAIDADGKPNANATVTSIKQVKVNNTLIMPGTYKDTHNGNCTVTVATLPSGRQEASIACANGTRYWAASVINGSIAGHPFELQLTPAGIGAIPGYRDYLWGVEGSSNYVLFTGACFSNNQIVSARQIGTQIVVTNYGADNISDCALTLTQVP